MNFWTVGVYFFHDINKRHVFWNILVFRSFRNQRDNIHTETINALGKPKIDNGINFFSQLRIFPVQVRLFSGIKMEVIFFCFGIPFPRTAIKYRLPIVGGRFWVAWFPNVIIVIGVVFPLFGLLKPRVLVRTVIGHQIHHEF